ncbi:trifolitoxin synthesis, TfuA [Allostella vacuolata]|nr:trifolitoxin synthesis, TfuA [Stella vacuolata]
MAVSLLGGFSAGAGDRPIDLRGRKSCALLGYLALSETGSETRERLVGLLWSESDDQRARGSLRQVLSELRQACDRAGYAGLRADKLAIGIERPGLAVDIWSVVTLAEQQQVHALLLNGRRLTETMLEGFEDVDPAFRVWLLARRQTLHDRLVRALEGGLAADGVEARRKAQMAEALLNLDPTHEQACRHLMASRAAAGDIATALRLYKSLWDLLDDEYGMEPSAPTQELVADIKSGAFEARRAAPAPADAEPLFAPGLITTGDPGGAPARVAPRLALAIVPFAIEGVDPDNIGFLQRFRHHLIACLARFREWRVTERAEAGGDGARYAILVSVYQSDTALTLILSVKDIASEQHIWSDRVQLRPDNVFEVQQRIVQRLTVALNVQLSAERLIRLAGHPNLPIEFHDRWLLGQELLAKRRPADWERATAIFNDMIREAPGFGPAYSSLVQLRNTAHIVHPGCHRTAAQQRETLILAKAAARIDAIDSRAQLCLGWAYLFDGQFEPGLLHFGLACDLNDADPWTLASAAHAHAFAGETARSRELADRAIELAQVPSALHWTYRAVMHFMWDDPAGCIAAADRSGDAAALAPMWRAAALAQLGRVGEARLEGRRFLDSMRRQWRGTGPATDAEVGRWIMQLFPIRHGRDQARLAGAITLAGIPAAAASP